MKYAAAIAAAFVAVVAADGWEVYTTVPAKPTTTPAAEEWASWSEEAPKPSTYNSWSEIEHSTYKPAPTTTWAVWASTTTAAPVYTTTKIPKYTGAANKANMVGAGAVGFAAVAFML